MNSTINYKITINKNENPSCLDKKTNKEKVSDEFFSRTDNELERPSLVSRPLTIGGSSIFRDPNYDSECNPIVFDEVGDKKCLAVVVPQDTVHIDAAEKLAGDERENIASLAAVSILGGVKRCPHCKKAVSELSKCTAVGYTGTYHCDISMEKESIENYDKHVELDDKCCPTCGVIESHFLQSGSSNRWKHVIAIPTIGPACPEEMGEASRMWSHFPTDMNPALHYATGTDICRWRNVKEEVTCGICMERECQDTAGSQWYQLTGWDACHMRCWKDLCKTYHAWLSEDVKVNTLGNWITFLEIVLECSKNQIT